MRNKAIRPIKLAVLLSATGMLISALAILPDTAATVVASSRGPTPGVTGAPGENNCTQCHVTNPVNSGGGSVRISGLPRNYRPDQQIPITVTTEMLGGVTFGFQFTALDARNLQVGTLSLPIQTPPQLQIVTGVIGGNQRRYVEHTSDGIIPTELDKKSWTFNWTAPASRVGKINFYVAGNAANSDGTNGGDYIYTASASVLSGSSPVNFDTDYKTDLAVFRPSQGIWYSVSSVDRTFRGLRWGADSDKPVPGDYDGDGKTDFALFRPSQGGWYIVRSGGGVTVLQFGTSGDIPAAGDYDGDLKTDIAVWRPSTGFWFVLRSSDGGVDIRQWGLPGDKVAQADFDGDAKTDIAVWRPETGIWYVLRSTDGGITYQQFGASGDRPVQADYDGDGRTDVAVFRPSIGVWFLLRSTSGFQAFTWGQSGDRPVPADYDGDGISDAAVYREGTWWIRRGSDGGVQVESFGTGGDIPLPASLIAE